MQYVSKKTRKIHANYSDKKSRFWKYIKRIAFFIFLFLLFLEFNHFIMAINALEQVNADQMSMIHDLAHKVQSLHTSNVDLHSQIDVMKIRINGLEISNQAIPINNVVPQTETPHINLHTESQIIHNSKSMIPSLPIVTTTAMAVLTMLKGIGSFLPALP